jgi:hypothetical protein
MTILIKGNSFVLLLWFRERFDPLNEAVYSKFCCSQSSTVVCNIEFGNLDNKSRITQYFSPCMSKITHSLAVSAAVEFSITSFDGVMLL